MRSFLRLLKLRKLAVYKLDLLKGGLTRCHGVLKKVREKKKKTILASVPLSGSILKVNGVYFGP